MAVTVFKLAQMSMTMIEGVIVRWLKQEGDFVKQDEPIVEVQTDKVVSEITSPTTGFIKKHIAQVGDVVPVGGDLCSLTTNEDELRRDSNDDKDLMFSSSAFEKKVIISQDFAKGIGKKKISPLAKRIANENNIDITTIDGSGPGGLIIRNDILRAVSFSESLSETISGEKVKPVDVEKSYSEVIPLAGIRKTTAEHMILSVRNTAAVTTFSEVNMTSVSQYRKVLPVSYTSYSVRAATLALTEFPIMNSALIDGNICIGRKININVAIAVGDALITPIIRDAGNKNLLSIADEIEELAGRGRKSKLTLEDFSGGTFTVTNSGVFGSLAFTPIINYPQCAILGLGKIQKVPVVRDDDTIGISLMMILCLTYDHQVVDGATSVRFLQRVKFYLENPDAMIKRKKGDEES